LDRPWIEDLRSALPELPGPRQIRLVSEYGLPASDAALIAADRELADLFEAAAKTTGDSKQTANWVIGEVAPTGRYPSPDHLAEVVTMVGTGKITRDQGREVLAETINGGGSPSEIVAKRGFAQISDESELRTIVEAVIAGNPKAVEDYRAGKKQAMQALMADVRARAPQANPKLASTLLLKFLK
jgi:aspartyl-tRNA(Asn)/glutamyl-tRNA(Gln) amidotransferase subunit B